jgi:hypothetical protein
MLIDDKYIKIVNLIKNIINDKNEKSTFIKNNFKEIENNNIKKIILEPKIFNNFDLVYNKNTDIVINNDLKSNIFNYCKCEQINYTKDIKCPDCNLEVRCICAIKNELNRECILCYHLMI